MQRAGMTKLNDSHKLRALPLMEHRKYERLPLRLPVRFINERGSATSCFTENISSEGFYCVSPDPFVPGDLLEVELFLPAHNPGRGEKRVRLTCQAQVVRIDSTWLGPGFGIGCRIEACTLHLEGVEP
jgi:PilZ domain